MKIKNFIRLNIMNDTLYFNYVDDKNSLYTWNFKLQNPSESERILFSGLWNHYKKYENVDIIFNSKDYRILKKNRWI